MASDIFPVGYSAVQSRCFDACTRPSATKTTDECAANYANPAIEFL